MQYTDLCFLQGVGGRDEVGGGWRGEEGGRVGGCGGGEGPGMDRLRGPGSGCAEGRSVREAATPVEKRPKGDVPARTTAKWGM